MWVLLSAGLHVAWNSLVKTSANPVIFLGLKGLFLMLVAALVVPLIGLSGLGTDAWLAIGASGILHALYALSLARAYERGDISFVYPIARSAPAFVPLVAWGVLGEDLTLAGAGGIALVVGGVLLLQIRDGGLSWATVVRSLGRPDGRWALATLACVVCYSLVDKAGMVTLANSRAYPPVVRAPLYFLLENAIAYTLYLGLLVWWRPPDALSVCRGHWRSALASAVMTMASYSLILHVMQTEPVSYIVAVRQCSVVLAVVFGWLRLREPQGPGRVFLSGLIAAGVAIVVCFG